MEKEKIEMKTMVDSLNKIVSKGYTENFKVVNEGLKSLNNEGIYKPAAVKVVDFYRFEGTSDPADESIIYVIETNDGIKGTLVDAFGPSADTKVTAFLKDVEIVKKKNAV